MKAPERFQAIKSSRATLNMNEWCTYCYTSRPNALSNACCAMQVWRFILEREVEAPERFQAIQSYRATMAVLRQQAMFVEQLFDTGVVDEMEKEELLQCAPRLAS